MFSHASETKKKCLGRRDSTYGTRRNQYNVDKTIAFLDSSDLLLRANTFKFTQEDMSLRADDPSWPAITKELVRALEERVQDRMNEATHPLISSSEKIYPLYLRIMAWVDKTRAQRSGYHKRVTFEDDDDDDDDDYDNFSDDLVYGRFRGGSTNKTVTTKPMKYTSLSFERVNTSHECQAFVSFFVEKFRKFLLIKDTNRGPTGQGEDSRQDVVVQIFSSELLVDSPVMTLPDL